MNFFFSAFRTLERAETLNLSAPEVKEQGGVEMQRPANGVAVLSHIHFLKDRLQMQLAASRSARLPESHYNEAAFSQIIY